MHVANSDTLVAFYSLKSKSDEKEMMVKVLVNLINIKS